MYVRLALPLAALLTLLQPAWAEDFSCPQCGCCRHTSVCRPKTEMREKLTYEYQLICEQVCMPGRSEDCGKKCVPDNRTLRGFHWETIWNPKAACVREKRTLAKVPVKTQEPVYLWEYHCVCCNCGYEQGNEINPAQPPEQQQPSPETPEEEEKLASRPERRPLRKAPNLTAKPAKYTSAAR